MIYILCINGFDENNDAPRGTVIKAHGHFGGHTGGQKFGPRSRPVKSKTEDEICDQTISARDLSLNLNKFFI
ncbi:hypothetical protein BpHYR1_043881 [Brachionus plicatilis]|uniref:Uncharacterized protein n=1 Tax=Brachionus plicatilis TaxID=10195 RepID=A0A3M7T864_BRAPC|nr:hypothetical protein BpHYR1_043881 [Brachionus plicatilis]